MNWISVKDRLPENDDPILVVSEGKIMSAYYECDEDFFLDDFFREHSHQCLYNVTHWRPLPELPDENKIKTDS